MKAQSWPCFPCEHLSIPAHTKHYLCLSTGCFYLFSGLFYFNLLCVCWVFCLYVCTPHTCLIPTEVRRRCGTPGTRATMFVHHHVRAGSRTQVLCKKNKCSLNLWAPSLGLHRHFVLEFPCSWEPPLTSWPSYLYFQCKLIYESALWDSDLPGIELGANFDLTE